MNGLKSVPPIAVAGTPIARLICVPAAATCLNPMLCAKCSEHMPGFYRVVIELVDGNMSPAAIEAGRKLKQSSFCFWKLICAN
jgi:hypothetical protein